MTSDDCSDMSVLKVAIFTCACVGFALMTVYLLCLTVRGFVALLTFFG